MPPKSLVSYNLNDRILCNYNGIYYEGKIVNVSSEDDERIFTVHYQGWHKRHDVDIKESMTSKLFLPYTEENVARAKAELENAKIERKRKAATKPNIDTVSNDSTSSASSVVTPRRVRAPKIVVPTLLQEAKSVEYYYGNLPKSLREILKKDQDAVFQRRLLAKLPAVYPIDIVLHEFLSTFDMELEWNGDKLIVSHGDEISSTRVTALIRACQMITDYFNMTLGKLLLYQPERDQYQSELLRLRLTNLNGEEDNTNKKPYLGSALLPDDTVPVRLTSVYGLPHLLRLFDCFADKFEKLPPDSSNILALKVMTSDFITFIDENREKYFSVRRDYEAQE